MAEFNLKREAALRDLVARGKAPDRVNKGVALPAVWLEELLDALDAERSRREAAERRATEATALLREHQWTFWQAGQPCCPECREWEGDGHAAGCRLAKVLEGQP